MLVAIERGLRGVIRLYLDVARNPSVRQRFVRNVIRFSVYERGYDGVDLNLEGWFEGVYYAQRGAMRAMVCMRELSPSREDLQECVSSTRHRPACAPVLAPDECRNCVSRRFTLDRYGPSYEL